MLSRIMGTRGSCRSWAWLPRQRQLPCRRCDAYDFQASLGGGFDLPLRSPTVDAADRAWEFGSWGIRLLRPSGIWSAEGSPMLSRVAESIYWMSRYVERAENVARFVDTNFNLMLDAQVIGEQWQPL